MPPRIPPPEKSIGQNLRGAFRALETTLTRELNAIGLQYSHFQVLHVLWHEDGITQSEVARASHITNSSFAQVVNKMVDEGLVERSRDSSDARKRIILLTAKGKAFSELAAKPVSKVLKIALAGLSEAEIEQYLATNIKVRRNLQAAIDAGNGESN